MGIHKQIGLVFTFLLFGLSAGATIIDSIQVSSKDITCFGANDGSAVITDIVGGTPLYRYEWWTGGFVPIPGETNDTITGLGLGNYFAVVYDVHNHSKFKYFFIDEPITITVTQNPNHFTFGKKMSYFNVRRGKERFSLHLSPTQKDTDAIPTVTFSFDSAPFMVRKDKWTLTKPDPLEGKYKLYATWGFGGAYNSNVVEIEVIGE